MSYAINRTDQNGAVLLTILDGTADGPDINPGLNATDLDLFGKNYALYGEFQNENFIKLLQNFANSVPPTKPLPGELWYDTGNNFLKVYNGSSFVNVSPVFVSATQPTVNIVGSQWWDSVNHQLYMYSGSAWDLVGPSYRYPDGKTGAVVDTILDIYGNTHTVTKFYNRDTVWAISCSDATWYINPNNAVAGFSAIAPGITLAIGVANEYKLIGTATNAEMLGNVVAANYARTDIVPTFTNNIFVAGGTVSIDEINDDARIRNTVNGANISVWGNVAGVSTQALTVWGADASVNVAANLNVAGTRTAVANDLTVGGNITVYGTTSGGATGVGQFVFDSSPALSGIPTAPNVALASANTAQIATMASVQNSITNATTAPWLGSQKTVSTALPVDGVGNPGDFWFQI